MISQLTPGLARVVVRERLALPNRRAATPRRSVAARIARSTTGSRRSPLRIAMRLSQVALAMANRRFEA